MAGRAPPGAVTRRDRAAQRVSPVARMSGRRPGRSLPCPPRPVRRGMSVQPVERTSSVQASGVQASGVHASGVHASGVQCHPGVRTDRAPVSAALPPRCPRRAGPWSSSVWRAARPGAAGRRGAVVCGRRGRLPASGRTGRGWCGVGRGWLARGSTLGQGRRLAGVPAAAPPGRRADTGAGPGQGAGRVAGEHGAEQVLTGPAGRPGQVAGVVPDHGPGSRGGDHAGWSLG